VREPALQHRDEARVTHSDCAEARVAGGEAARASEAPVAGAVVHDHALEAPLGLPRDAAQTDVERVVRIVDG
jgi:hypothetical protein